jgi:hypothetical protein
MKLTCPNCQATVPAGDINVASDLAKCALCDEIFKPSECLTAAEAMEAPDLPTGSDITFEEGEGGNATFFLPKRGMKGGDLFMMMFATFWIVFVAFWTVGAAGSSIFFAAFSIPFWVVGIFMWRGVLLGITERQTIAIGRASLTITRKSLVSKKRQSIPYSEIQTISIEALVPRDPFTMARHMRGFNSFTAGSIGFQLPTISHGTKQTRFAEHVSDAEMKWLVKTLNVIVLGGAPRPSR